MKRRLWPCALAGCVLMSAAGCAASDPAAPVVRGADATIQTVAVTDAEGSSFAGWPEAGADALTYVPSGETLWLEFPGETPDTVEVRDTLLNADGSPKYAASATQTYAVTKKDEAFCMALEPHPAAYLSSDSKDYEKGASYRGLQLVCRWGDTESAYAFAVRS